MAKRRAVAILGVLAVLLVPAAALAQLHSGDIYGTVVDEQKQPLPGVTLTLTGVGAPQTTQTDEHGAFRFTDLYPGQYAIKAEIEGFSSIEQSDIGVRIGSKVQLDLTASSAIKETITVTAEHLVINPREQNIGPALTPQDLEKIPTARDPWSLLRQAPGVQTDRVNVGGNESGQQSSFFVGGATSADNTFAVDGAIETDMAAVGGSAGYYDFGAYEEFQLITASTDVSIQTAGVTINQVTKRGSNTWKGDARYLKTDGSLQSKPSTAGYPEDIVGNEIKGVEEYGFNLGGPVVKDHLWIWGSYGISDIQNILGVTGQVDRTKLDDTNVKANFQVGGNSGSLLYWDNDKRKFGRGAAFDRPPETTLDQTTPAERWKFEDTQIFGSNFSMSLLAATNEGGFTLHPKGGDVNAFMDEQGINRGSYFVFDQTATIDQYKIDGAYFMSGAATNHELKFGGSYREQENDSLSTLPGDGTFVYACEGYGCEPTDEDGNFLDNVELVEWIRHNVAVTTKYKAAWLQDTITHDRWTLSAGVRWDKQNAHNDPVHDPGQPEVPNGLFPEINFPGADAGFDWTSIVPRVGVTYALGEKRQTLLRGTYSQYAAQLGQWVPNLIGTTSPYSYAYFYFTDANRNLRLDPDERDSLSYYYYYNVNTADPSASPNRVDPDLKPYKTDEATFALQHAFGNNVGVSATFVWRQTKDLLEKRLLVFDDSAPGGVRVATTDDYERDDDLVRYLPDGREILVPSYSIVNGTGGGFLTNGDRKIDYWGITLGVDKPMSNHWSLRGNFTYGDAKLKVGDQFRRFDDPTDIISLGFGLWGDSSDIYIDESYGTHKLALLNNRWSFNIAGIYEVAPDRPWGFNVGANFNGREGYPFVPANSASVHTIQVDPKLDDFRFNDLYDLDLRVDKPFTIGDVKLTAALSCFNVLNNQVVLERNPRAARDRADLPDSYPVVSRLSPRVFRWGITVFVR
jgi:hypothetical protein